MSDLNDVVGDANLFNGSNYGCTYDRFCQPKSAIYFNNGYLRVPPGVYISGDFTIIVWIKWKLIAPFATIIELSGDLPVDKLKFGMDSTGKTLKLDITSANVTTSFVGSTIQLNEWCHVSIVTNETAIYMFVNGIQTYESVFTPPNIANRINNFIGGKSLPPNAVLDEVKFYRGAFTSDQILDDYMTSSSNGIHFNHILVNHC